MRLSGTVGLNKAMFDLLFSFMHPPYSVKPRNEAKRICRTLCVCA